MKDRRINMAWLKDQQVTVVILFAGVALFVFWYFVLWPLNRRKRDLEQENRIKSDELAIQQYGHDVPTRTARRTSETDSHNKLRLQWQTMAARLVAFPDQRELTTSWIGHIDYKRAFHEVRQLLYRKSTTVAVALPESLGMSDEVRSDEDARKLMLQLRAMEKVVSIALDLKIERIIQVQPLPPQEYRIGEAEEVYLEEYPVFLSFRGRIEAMHDLFEMVLKQGDACVFRNVRVEKNDTERESVLDINVVLSALVFTKRLNEISWPQTVRKGVLNPDGH